MQNKIVKPQKHIACLTLLSLPSFLYYAVQFVKLIKACIRMIAKVRIYKKGRRKLRHTLYMCALNAKKTNKQLFDRLVANGKNKKLAIIAVCNKLLKQVFGVIKSGKPYDKNYALNYV